MRKIIYTLILSGLYAIATAQITDNEKLLRTRTSLEDTTDNWKFGGVMSVQFANTQLYNWASGGDNSIAINGRFNLFANYKKGMNTWENCLDLGYGIMRQGTSELENGEARPFKKTDDKIDFTSKYGRIAFGHVYYAALLNFKTQMTTGKSYTNDTTYTVVSKALAPAYLSGGIGFDYKPNNFFSLYVSPINARFIIVNDQDLADAGSFGVTAAKYDDSNNLLSHGEKIKEELGGYIRLQYSRNDWKAEFLKSVAFTTKLDLFSNYIENPQNVDVDWETLIAFKINKYLMVSFNTQLLYDDDTKNPVDLDNDGTADRIDGPKVQFKEILGIGFTYKL